MPKDLSPGFSSKNVTAENKLTLSAVNELVNIDRASFASPITFYCGFELGNVLFKTSQANTHFTVNLLGGPGASFSSLMAIGEIRTVTLIILVEHQHTHYKIYKLMEQHRLLSGLEDQHRQVMLVLLMMYILSRSSRLELHPMLF